MIFKRKQSKQSPSPIRLDPKCAVCGQSAAEVELVPAGVHPSRLTQWPKNLQETYHQYRDLSQPRLLYSGPGGSSGTGNDITQERFDLILRLFTPPYDEKELKKEFYDRAGMCADCGVFYCSDHWNISGSGYGGCPKGHGASLDPHWSPDYDYDD